MLIPFHFGKQTKFQPNQIASNTGNSLLDTISCCSILFKLVYCRSIVLCTWLNATTSVRCFELDALWLTFYFSFIFRHSSTTDSVGFECSTTDSCTTHVKTMAEKKSNWANDNVFAMHMARSTNAINGKNRA